MIDLAEAAYKPAEDLLFSYIEIHSILGHIAREQELSGEVRNQIVNIYNQFQDGMDEILERYDELSEVLPKATILDDAEAEAEDLLLSIGLSEPFVASDSLNERLILVLKNIIIDIQYIH